jgi:hypothetical protein
MTERIRKHGRLLPADTRLEAWEIMTGEHDATGRQGRSRKPHRGALPDVDFGAAVRDLERRSLLRRIVQRFWRAAHNGPPRPADWAMSGTTAPTVGRPPSLAYIEAAEPSDDKLAAPEKPPVLHARAA